jgi:hypothetical protein
MGEAQTKLPASDSQFVNSSINRRGWLTVDEWEVPDPYDACIKCKRAFDQAWP